MSEKITFTGDLNFINLADVFQIIALPGEQAKACFKEFLHVSSASTRGTGIYM